MPRYSEERKQVVLNKLLPPLNMTVAEVARSECISAQTLYTWRDKAKQQGYPVPGKKPTSEQWSAEAKLAVVIETATLGEAELSEYCRTKGLYVEQVKAWKSASLQVSIGTLLDPLICGVMDPLKTVIFALKQGDYFSLFPPRPV